MRIAVTFGLSPLPVWKIAKAVSLCFRKFFAQGRLNGWLLASLLLGRGSFAATTELAAPLQPSSPSSELNFEQHIRPILKANCFDCHGEGEKLKGGLDLRLRRLILQGGKSGSAIVPGDPAQSRLVQLIAEGEMPRREKKLSPAQIEIIRSWIASGAKTARAEPGQIGKGMTITDEERAFWSFQPIRRPAVPQMKARDQVRTPVDAFLLAALGRGQLSFSPEADKRALLRRAYFDLTGLPPTPEEAALFLADDSPGAYERLIERLLDSPHYGERWGRHWLDVAGYADSDGYTDADTPREFAYKYRDYVIRSFNEDKPFPQFIEEQLAGDEMLAGNYKNLSRAQIEKLAATGFLRMAADGTAQAAVVQDLARNQVIGDTLKIVSSSLLGLSVGCAQCHDHRYDPIPQADYYRLRAVFEPAFDWKSWRAPAQRLVSLYTDDDRAQAAQIEAEAGKLAAEKEKKQKDHIAEALEKHLREKFSEPLRESLRAALQTAADKRTAEQKKLLGDNPSVNIHPGVLYQYNPKAAEELKGLDATIAAVRARKTKEDFIQCLTEIPGQIPATFLFHRGDPKQPRERIAPGGLTILSPANERLEIADKDFALASTGRRWAWARWITSTNNPQTARVLVNRVWMHHFGRGLVGTPSDFGMTGERPTHPELLDWLASKFLEQGGSVKELHRIIMRSAAYRQTSSRNPPDSAAGPVEAASSRQGRLASKQPSPFAAAEPRSMGLSKAEQIDPDNRLYWRWPIRRLDAEAVRDAILVASGAFDARMFGPPVPVREDGVGQVVVGVDKKEGDTKVPVVVPMGGEEFRRSVYIEVRRSQPLAFLNSFDAPVMEVNCERRPSSTVATQALMLMNSEFILQQAGKFAQRLRSEAGPDRRQRIARAWEWAFSRPATEQELLESLQFLAQQAGASDEEAARSSAGEGKAGGKAPAPKPDSELQALTSLCQSLLSANEFLYLD